MCQHGGRCPGPPDPRPIHHLAALGPCGGDYGAAFARFEQRLMPFLKRKQLSVAKSASSVAPKTALEIRFRNLVVRLMRRLPFVIDFYIGRELRDQVELPDYRF